MDLVVTDVDECGKVLNQIGVSLVNEASDELSFIVVVSRNDSADTKETVDLSDVEVVLLGNDTKDTVRCALHISTSIAVGDADGIVGCVSIEDVYMSDLYIQDNFRNNSIK